MKKIKEPIIWSHSKLNQILACPMTYHLHYDEGILPKQKKTALSVGGAIHWGIEHNTDDLSEYFEENASFKNKDTITQDEILSSAVVHGYLKNKDKIFSDILGDCELLEEEHELTLTADLKSFKWKTPHKFLGRIDLLLLTDRGFIIIDYKTSSKTPNFDDYKDQIYRYVFLLKATYPEIPLIKVGIVNLRKTLMKQRQNESTEDYLNRLFKEYEENTDNYISSYIFENEMLDNEEVDNYINNLSKLLDLASFINENKMWAINFNNAVTQYGKSDYYDILYKVPDAYLLYDISDHIFDKDTKEIKTTRDCEPLDMLVVDYDNVLNKYGIYKEEIGIYLANGTKKLNKTEFHNALKTKYLCDDKLLNLYWTTYQYEVSTLN